MAVRASAGLVGRFLGNTVSEAAAFGAGVALGPVLGPPVQALRNEVNAQYPFVPIAPGILAEGVSQGQIAHDVAQGIANQSGISDANFDRMVAIANVGPGSGYAFELWRRGEIDEAGFRRAVKRMGLEQEWIDDLVKIKGSLLTPGELAAAIHRGLVPNAGLVLGEQPEPPFKVDAYPVYPVDPVAEAAGSGYDKDRLGVLVGLQGLPMGVIEAAHSFWRGIITHGDYIRAFNTSNSRNEWAEAVLEYSRQIPTARDFMENALRGHHDFEWAAQQAGRHGMTRDDAFLIYQNQGRPLNLHQISQGLAWGGEYKPGPGDDPDPWMQAVLLGAVRPEYYDLQKHLKYIVPSTFAIRALAESGVWDEAKTATRLKQAGWIPEDAEEVAKAWTTQTAATPKENPYVSKADNQLWTALHKAYVKTGAPRAEVEPILTHLITGQAVRDEVFTDWDFEREAQALAPPAA